MNNVNIELVSKESLSLLTVTADKKHAISVQRSICTDTNSEFSFEYLPREPKYRYRIWNGDINGKEGRTTDYSIEELILVRNGINKFLEYYFPEKDGNGRSR